MAIYHCSIKIINRASGRSAIAASAYRSGTKLKNEESGKIHNFQNKKGVIYSEIDLPKNAPKEFANREILWNSVQGIEKNSNAQLAREVEIALPNEWDYELQKNVVQQYVKEQFVSNGMCADWALHDKGDGNPHAHILLTTRPITSKGNWGKKTIEKFKLDENGNRIPKIDPKTGKQKLKIRKGHGSEKLWEKEKVSIDWNNRDNAEKWRSAWAEICNKHLDLDNQIDHRSYKRQGIEQFPTIHLGHTALEMQKRGRISDRISINKSIAQSNFDILELNEREKNLATEIEKQTKVLNNKKNNLIANEFNKRYQDTISILKEEKPTSIEAIMEIYHKNGLKLKKDTNWRIGFCGRDWTYNKVNLIEEIAEKNLQQQKADEEEKIRQEQERLAAGKAKKEADERERLLETQRLAIIAAEEEKKKEKKRLEEASKAEEKERLLNAIKDAMKCNFTDGKEWTAERKKRNIHMVKDHENNIIYRFETGMAEISSKDYPEYSFNAIMKKASDNKMQKDQEKKRKMVNQNSPTVKSSRGKGLSRSRRR